MTSAELKYAVLWHWRFKLRAKYLATEMFAGTQNIRDVMIIDKSNRLIEIECKTSVADFKEDFKKAKHWAYTQKETNEKKYYVHPMEFYFAFPEELKLDISALDEFSKYGVIRVSRKSSISGGQKIPYRVVVERHAKTLTEKDDKAFREEYCEQVIPMFVMRMTSEIVGLHAKLLDKKKETEPCMMN